MPFFRRDQQLDQWGDQILSAIWAEFPELAENQIGLTWVVYDEPVPVNTGGALTAEEFWKYGVRGFAYRGIEPIYPAGLVQLFYLVAAYEWLEKGMIQPSGELNRAIQDMIVASSNDATSLVIDVLTGTTSGPELPSGPFETWKYQRNIVNRYFQSLGWPELETININQKTWGDGAYGRERIFLGEAFENQNKLTTNATARLLHSIVGGIAVSSRRSQDMMALMQQAWDTITRTAHSPHQTAGLLAAALPDGAQVWSKAGQTNQVCHIAAYIELPEQRPYLLVVFTEGRTYSLNQTVLSHVSQQIATAVTSLN